MSLIQRSWHRIETAVDGTLLDAQTTNTNGIWSPLGARPWTVTARGVWGGASVTVYVSNQVARPLDTDNTQAVFQIFAAPGSGESNGSYRWIKAQLASAGGGTSITVDVMGG